MEAVSKKTKDFVETGLRPVSKSTAPKIIVPFIIETDKKGKVNGHFKGPIDEEGNQDARHFPVDETTGLQNGQGDFEITVVEAEASIPNDSEADCLALDAALNPVV